MSGSSGTAAAVVAALIRGGVTDVVLAPGSRSAGLAVAFHQAEAEGELRLQVRIDERSAGFLALGIAKSSRRPVAVLTTSGTAVANLHPAVLEAHHSGIRLLVVAADRPAELRGTGANQTTEQAGIFGAAAPCVDVATGDLDGAVAAVQDAIGRTGPTQLNLQLAEPLLPERLPLDLPAAAVLADRRPDRRPDGPKPASKTLPIGPRTVVVAGDDAGPAARWLAETGNWPLLAEPTSGARAGTHALRCYRMLLGTALADRIERVVVAGHPTLSRPVSRLISRADVEVLSVVGPGGIATDPGRVAVHLDTLPEAGGSDGSGWLDEWRAADSTLGARLDALVARHVDAAPLRVAAAVARATIAGTMLFVGSSQPVRDLDLMMAPYPPGQRRFVVANRGLAGIDGTVSSAIGAALGRPSTRALAYLGDLTFLHDSNGLVIGPDEPRPDLTFVVANDDGGAIFSTLEQGDPAYSAGFERVFGTPHGVDLRALCAATRTEYAAVAPDQLDEALGQPQHGLRVLDVKLSRSGRRRLADAVARLSSQV